jgi:hypothetical protein
LARASGTQVPSRLDLDDLAKALASASVAIIGSHVRVTSWARRDASAEALRASWNLPIGASSRSIVDDDERVTALFDVVSGLIAEIQARVRPVLLVIDGLDRVQGIERARQLFVESDVLARLPCRIVICGPYSLHRHAAALAVSRFQLRSLVNEPVLDPSEPARSGAGVRLFTELFLQRTMDLGGLSLITQQQLDRLAYYSGDAHATSFGRSARSRRRHGRLTSIPRPRRSSTASSIRSGSCSRPGCIAATSMSSKPS